MSVRESFLAKLRASLQSGDFVKLTLSQPGNAAEADLRNVYARIVELREGRRLSLVWHYAKRDVTKNLPFDEAAERIASMLGGEFERAHLFTITDDWQLRCDAQGEGKLKASRPAFTQAPSPEHDREKPRVIAAASSPFLEALGVTNAAGEARPGMADKLRQIERFAEILTHLLDASPLRERRELTVVDMGAGKGYLTFATFELLRNRGVQARVIGVEARQDLVDLTNEVARKVGFEGLEFVRGAIGDFSPPERLDVLIALHACNTATDDALFQGIRAGTSLLVTAPCCHQELRPQLTAPPVLRDVLRHGILLEREAEILTDGIRAMLLEIAGYQANVFEFISSEHTGKNLMIAAHRRPEPLDPEGGRQRLRTLFEQYGIREQRLAHLLGEG